MRQRRIAAAEAMVTAARSGVRAAEERLSANQAMTEGTSIEAHPSVAQAAARVREAYVTLARCQIAAPVGGDVVRRTVQVGQRVQPGTPLLSLVTLAHVWVDANFKEVQLGDMRIGQPVKVHADVYGDDVVYDGHIVGFSAGTGAAFALLPAQNATGNWIKIVQRVPVRIELNPGQVDARPLRVGLSVLATVEALGPEIKSLLFIGVGCQVQALRSVTTDLGLEKLFVLGTNCTDNGPREG